MPITVNIPNIEEMMSLSDRDFAALAAEGLAKYDMKRGAFNIAANSPRPVLTPVKDRMYFYPEESERFIGTGLRVLEEFDAIGKVTKEMREKFIIEQAKDAVSTAPFVQERPHFKETDDYKNMVQNMLDHVNSRLKGIGSLPDTVSYNMTFKLKPPGTP